MLPQRALILIREYSKPLTRPNWRKGALHVLCIKQSPVMKYMIRQIQKEIHYMNIRNSYALLYNYGETIFNPKEIRHCEDLINIYLNNINFYACAQRFLKPTLTLHCNTTYDVINGKKYYEYVFVKN